MCEVPKRIINLAQRNHRLYSQMMIIRYDIADWMRKNGYSEMEVDTMWQGLDDDTTGEFLVHFLKECKATEVALQPTEVQK